MFKAFCLVRSGFYGLIYHGKIAKSDISTCAYMRGNRVHFSHRANNLGVLDELDVLPRSGAAL